jgi:TRAP-type C4-dicarboxylate transport system permease small subunit
MFLISSISTLIAWEIFLAAILIVFAILIVWYAWKWPKQPLNK